MNLLIVDDEMLEVTVIEKMIDTKALGIEQIFKAYSMNQAITVLEKENVAILLTDIEMPKGSGIRLAEWVKEQDIPLIVIFLTSHAVFDYAKKAVELEVKQYLLKPVRKEELIKTLQDAREGYQKMIQQQSYEQQKSSAGIRNVNPEDLLDEKGKMTELIDQVKDYIADHLDEELKRTDLAAMIYLHPDYLSHVFKDETGMSLSEYITRKRIDYAMMLLEKTNRSVSDIAAKCGYASLAYFTKTFKRIIGMSPKGYRKVQKEKKR